MHLLEILKYHFVMKGLIKILIILGASVLIGYDVVYIAATRTDEVGVSKLFKTKDISSLEGKFEILLTSLFYLGIFVLSVVLFVTSIRIVTTKVDPIGDAPPTFVKCGNQILSNTIEQAIVFYGFYFYWLNLQKNNKQLKLAILLPALFLIGRVLFAVGYIIGVKIHLPQLRAAGFFINLLAIAAILADVQNVPFMTKYFA